MVTSRVPGTAFVRSASSSSDDNDTDADAIFDGYDSTRSLLPTGEQQASAMLPSAGEKNASTKHPDGQGIADATESRGAGFNDSVESDTRDRVGTKPLERRTATEQGKKYDSRPASENSSIAGIEKRSAHVGGNASEKAKVARSAAAASEVLPKHKLSGGNDRSRKWTGSREKVLTRLYEGNSFGEMALIYDEPRNATVRATTKVRIITPFVDGRNLFSIFAPLVVLGQ